MKSPYPYFGGKSQVAAEVWRRLGRTDTYVEPFWGSGAVYLACEWWNEFDSVVVNDLSHYIANFWRALQAAPDEVAYYADYPTSEADLYSRHLWLVSEGRERIAACGTDPNHYDAQVAGWWVWGMANWIGSGWCTGKSSYGAPFADGRLAHERRPHLGDRGKGVNRQLPHLRNNGQGVNRQLPHLGNNGQGVNRQLPHLGDRGQGDDLFPTNHSLYHYIRQLAERMRPVRVCCGDWSRVVKPAVTWAGEEGTQGATCAVFLDPPYSAEASRDMSLYDRDDGEVAHAVREWCIANDHNSLLRIALCGYEGEHDELEARGWSVYAWKASGGYGEAQGKGRGATNRNRERIWFSPSCVHEMPLFDLTTIADAIE